MKREPIIRPRQHKREGSLGRFIFSPAGGFPVPTVLNPLLTLPVIHALESSSAPQKDPEEKDRLCAWIPNELRPKCTFQEVIRRGNAAEQIIDLAASMEADLIVLGAQDKPFSDSTVIGTTTVNVTRHSPCPVLTVISK